MWILIIVSLVTGEKVIEEPGFRNQVLCEQRLALYKGLDTSKYRGVCVRKLTFNEGELDNGTRRKSGVRYSAADD